MRTSNLRRPRQIRSVGLLVGLIAIVVSGCARKNQTQPEVKDPSGGVAIDEIAGEAGPSKPLEIRRKIADFRFVDQDGRAFGSQELKGNHWIANFIFVRCGGTCPRMSAKVKELQVRLAKKTNVRFVTITVDPAHDTVADLKAYAGRYEADLTRWHFLRGEEPELKKLYSEGFVLTNGDDIMNHSTRFVLVDDKSLAIRVYDVLSEVDGDQHFEALARDLAAL